ncbi:PAS domain S-box protein [Microbacteriaceae bacterium 4G12]
MESVHLSGELLIFGMITVLFGCIYINLKKRRDSILVEGDLVSVWRQPMYMQFFRKQRHDEQVKAPVMIEVGNQIVYANDAALEMLGARSIDQLVGKSVQAFIVPTLQMEFGKRKQEGTLHFFESEMMRCNGTSIIAQMVGVDTEFEGERAVRFLFCDVTAKHQAVHQVIEEKKQLESFFTMSADAMYILNLDRTVVQVNAAFEKLFGYKEEELRGKVMPDVFQFTVEELQGIIKKLEAGNVVHCLEVFAEKSNKERIPVSSTLSPIRDEQGQFVMISGVVRDITMQKMYEQALLESQQRYRMIAENLHDYILMFSKDLVITYMSPSIRNALELEVDELIGIHCFNMIAEMDLPVVREKIGWMIQEKDSIRLECRVRNKQSEYVWVETRMIPVLNEQKDIDYIVASMKDISDRKDYQVQLEKLAFSDSLTEVANRHAFEGRLKSRIESKEPFALFYLDFDKLKWINDTFSHECGDLFLKEATQRVRKAVRSSDFIARLGGDEFVIIVQSAQEEELELVARRIVRAFHEPFQYEGHSFVSTVSIGIALYPRDGKDHRTLVLHADEALYYVKGNGRNNYRFYHQTV